MSIERRDFRNFSETLPCFCRFCTVIFLQPDSSVEFSSSHLDFNSDILLQLLISVCVCVYLFVIVARCFFAPGRGAKYCHYRDLYVCLSVCLSAHISQKPHIQILRNFLYMLSVTVALSFSDGSAIRYALPLMWMTSYFHIMDRIGQNQIQHICFV